MDRRQVIGSMLAACAASAVRPGAAAAQAHAGAHAAGQATGGMDHSKYHDIKHEQIVLVAYPMMTALDLLGPQYMFGCMMGAKVMIAAQTMETVNTDSGLKIVPDIDFASCPREVDLFLVPGGLAGTTAAMKDPRMTGFIRELGEQAKYVTSVCTGSLVLGAAGLLKGYRATSHWLGAHMLPDFGATPVNERVVIDRNRITGAGVTAGMDMALTVVQMLRGEEYARMVALLAEYDPHPPVKAGTPKDAGPKVTDMLRDMYEDWLVETEAFAKGPRHG